MITFPISFAVFVGLSKRVRDSHIITDTSQQITKGFVYVPPTHSKDKTLCYAIS